jgi:hypothetical protein
MHQRPFFKGRRLVEISEGTKVTHRTICFYGLVVVFTGLRLSLCQADVEHCRFIRAAKDRLACFDKEAAPVQVSRDPPASDPGKEKPESPSEFLKRENDFLDIRMGTICRGC